MKKVALRIGTLILGIVSVFLIILQALPIFSATPNSSVMTVSADESVNYLDWERGDGQFEWADGVFMEYTQTELNKLGFRINVANPDIFKFHKDGENQMALMFFTVCRTVGEKGVNQRAIPIYQILIYSIPGFYAVGHKRLAVEEAGLEYSTIREGQIEIVPNQKDDAPYFWTAEELESDQKKYEFEKDPQLHSAIQILGEILMPGFGFTTDYLVAHGDETKVLDTMQIDGYPCFNLLIETDSPHVEYMVAMNSQLDTWEGETKTTGALWWKKRKKVNKRYISKTRSYSASVKQFLLAVQRDGELEKEFGSVPVVLQKAKDIIELTEEKSVTIAYLQQIGSSPFAQRVVKDIVLPVTAGKVCYADVCNALRVSTLNVLGASVIGFEQDSFGVYQAEYASSAHVIAKTVDGNKQDYYLSFNKTFADFYSEFTNDSVFSAGAIEYAFNSIVRKYVSNNSALDGFTPETLYGLWGYVVVPRTNTWNAIFADIFDVPTDFDGVLQSYELRENLSIASYNKLLSDYGYNWIERIWQDFLGLLQDAGTYEATHFLFYADPQYEDIKIAENGDVNSDKGVIVNKTEELVDEIVNAIEEKAEETENVAKKAWRVVGIVGAVVGGIALVFGGVFVWFKYVQPEINRSSRRKR